MEKAYFGLVWRRENVTFLSLYDGTTPGNFEPLEDADAWYDGLDADQFGLVSAVINKDGAITLQDHGILTMNTLIDELFDSGELHTAMTTIYTEVIRKDFVN